MQRVVKPKNARSKRALKAREPKPIEGEKKAIFVKGSQTSKNVNMALGDLYQLRKPSSILFSKKNPIHPFEESANQTLSFWSEKNDAGLFLIGLHSKKRPNDLVWVRMFDGRVLDMLETGVDGGMGLSDIKGLKTTPGLRPLFHFSSPLFDSHPLYIQFKSILLDFFNGDMFEDKIDLRGLERVICVTVGEEDEGHPSGTTTTTTTTSGQGENGDKPPPTPLASLAGQQPSSSSMPQSSSGSSSLPLVHFRVYSISLFKSNNPHQPTVQLSPHGPFLDFSLRRSQPASESDWKKSTKYQLSKTKKKMSTTLDRDDKEGGKKKLSSRKNIDIDDMGDKVGKIHVGRQIDGLEKLQSRKMKGLRRDNKREFDESDGDEESSDFDSESSGEEDGSGTAMAIDGKGTIDDHAWVDEEEDDDARGMAKAEGLNAQGPSKKRRKA